MTESNSSGRLHSCYTQVFNIITSKFLLKILLLLVNLPEFGEKTLINQKLRGSDCSQIVFIFGQVWASCYYKIVLINHVSVITQRVWAGDACLEGVASPGAAPAGRTAGLGPLAARRRRRLQGLPGRSSSRLVHHLSQSNIHSDHLHYWYICIS